MSTFPRLPRIPAMSITDVIAVQPDHDGVEARESTVDCAVYVDGERLPGTYTHDAAVAKLADLKSQGARAFVWLGLLEPAEDQMQRDAELFGLHSLAVDGAIHAHPRPRLEIFDTTLMLTVKTIDYVEHETLSGANQIVHTGEVTVIVADDFVITVRHGSPGRLTEIRRALEADPERLAVGAWQVMATIVDAVTTRYQDVVDAFENDVDAVQEHVFASSRNTDIERIYLLKRELIEMKRGVGALAPVLARLAADEGSRLPIAVRGEVRGSAEKNTATAERVAIYDELADSLLNAALGRVGVQQNIDMRRISAGAALAVVPTMIAGIYGMNFDHMPELHWAWGYPASLGLMLAICILLIVVFRRQHWI
jgi:magnesium transporter